MPPSVGVLIGLTAILSLVGVIGERMGFGLLSRGALVPSAVFHGEVWRLVSWIFFELQPISLVFACLMIYWFGRDLAQLWGARKFVLTYLGFAVVVGLATSLVGRFLWHGIADQFYLGTWPITEALVIAWAMTYPDRKIMFYFVVPMGGRTLIYVTLGGTILYAIFEGVAAFVPHFISEGLMLLYMSGLSPKNLWRKVQYGRLQRRAAHLRVVPRDDQPSKKWLN